MSTVQHNCESTFTNLFARRGGAVAIFALALSLPALSIAQANDAVDKLTATQRPIYKSVQRPKAPSRSEHASPVDFSTIPQLSPDFHGSNGG